MVNRKKHKKTRSSNTNPTKNRG